MDDVMREPRVVRVSLEERIEQGDGARCWANVVSVRGAVATIASA